MSEEEVARRSNSQLVKVDSKLEPGDEEMSHAEFVNLLQEWVEYAEKSNLVEDILQEENGTGVWFAEQQARIDLSSLKSLFYNESWVYIIVNSVARKVSGQDMYIQRELIQDGNPVLKPAENHPLSEILKKPNRWESRATFFYKIAAELCLMGNAVIWWLKENREMMLIPSENVFQRFSPDGRELISYQILTEDVSVPTVKPNVVDVPLDQIMHIKQPHLKNMFWGASAWVSGRKSVLFDRYSTEYLINFYLKNATPGMALEMGKEANEKQALRLLKSFELQHTGRRNQRRTFIAPKGVTIKNMMHTLAEQNLTEHINLKRDEIMGLLLFPRHELGIQQTGALGTSETVAQQRNFWQATLIPYQDMILGEFNRFFEKDLGEKYSFAYDNSDVLVLQENQLEKADLSIKLKDVWTLNEIRTEIWEKPERPEGDMIVGAQKPQQQLPFLFQAPEIETKETKDIDIQDSPHIPIKTQDFLAKNADWWATRQKQENDSVDKGFDEMVDVNLDLFAEFAAVSIAVVKKHLNQTVKADDDIPPKMPSRRALRRDLSKGFQEVRDQWVDGSSDILESRVELGYDLQLNVPFNLPSQDEINALRAENEKGRRRILETRLIDSFDKMDATTTDQVIKEIARGVEQRKTIDQIAADVASYYRDADNIAYRATRIARTETLTAVSLGQWAATQDAKTVIPNLRKMWITAGDDRVRDSHIPLDGEIIDVDQEFSNGLKFPRDPTGPANETIQCRCTMLMIPSEDDILEGAPKKS